MHTTKTRTAKVIVAPTHGSSGNDHADRKGDGFGSSVKFDDETYDSSPVIGASLVQFFSSGSIEYVDETKSNVLGDGNKITGEARFNNPKACQRNGSDLRNPSLSLLLDGGISNSSDNVRNSYYHGCQPQLSRKRILLRGPPRSGKTSLAMDLAYAKASAAKNYTSENSCVAIIYRFNQRKHIDNNKQNCRKYHEKYYQHNDGSDPFPLFCRAVTKGSNEKYRDNINTNESRDRLEPTILPNVKAVPSISTTQRDKEYTWDPNTLNRIKICYVSSVWQLWEDLLMLVSKPIHKQPACVIIVEDLDKIVLWGEKGSNSNHTNEIRGKYNKQNKHIDMMLKTISIATDTALAIDEGQRKFKTSSSLSQADSVTLLVTLTIDSRRLQIDVDQNQRNVVANMMDLSDVLVLISSIDTVITLHQNRRRNLPTNDDDNDGESVSCSRMKLITTFEHTNVQVAPSNVRDEVNENINNNCNISSNNKNDIKSTILNETTLVNSIWQAEIKEHEANQYHGKICDSVESVTNDAALVDYSFVESFLKKDGNNSFEECKGNLELQWNHCSIIP
mmetsp:Transcript_12137/g.28794  ORF Transcript_12137/g.28794 Transcript_12137/m.28794 type:complete len:562 (-) Transcript_12137:18-1703(-)